VAAALNRLSNLSSRSEFVRLVMEVRIVEDDPDAALFGQGEENPQHIRLVQVIGKDIEPQLLVFENRIEEPEDPFPAR
jgi:hypothetical protein